MLRAFALIFTLALSIAPAHAQQQSFAAFEAALWPDAKAKGITRATFDLALRGVTPDKRVIAAIKRQPEYGKPFGDYVNAIVSKGRVARGQREARKWSKLFDQVERKYRRRALGAAGALGHRDRLRRGQGPLGRVPLAGDARLYPLPPALFPQRAAWWRCASCRTTTSRAGRW